MRRAVLRTGDGRHATKAETLRRATKGQATCDKGRSDLRRATWTGDMRSGEVLAVRVSRFGTGDMRHGTWIGWLFAIAFSNNGHIEGGPVRPASRFAGHTTGDLRTQTGERLQKGLPRAGTGIEVRRISRGFNSPHPNQRDGISPQLLFRLRYSILPAALWRKRTSRNSIMSFIK